jgi:hypothetical protein
MRRATAQKKKSAKLTARTTVLNWMSVKECVERKEDSIMLALARESRDRC